MGLVRVSSHPVQMPYWGPAPSCFDAGNSTSEYTICSSAQPSLFFWIGDEATEYGRAYEWEIMEIFFVSRVFFLTV
jgi:hypothetical protein